MGMHETPAWDGDDLSFMAVQYVQVITLIYQSHGAIGMHMLFGHDTTFALAYGLFNAAAVFCCGAVIWTDLHFGCRVT